MLALFCFSADKVSGCGVALSQQGSVRDCKSEYFTLGAGGWGGGGGGGYFTSAEIKQQQIDKHILKPKMAVSPPEHY